MVNNEMCVFPDDWKGKIVGSHDKWLEATVHGQTACYAEHHHDHIN